MVGYPETPYFCAKSLEMVASTLATTHYSYYILCVILCVC
jgi:hypothetical protein